MGISVMRSNIWGGRTLGLGLALAAGWCNWANAQTSCSTQGKAQLLTEFSDVAAPGSITPQVLRNFVCSTIIFSDSGTPWVIQGPVTFNGAVVFASSASITGLTTLNLTQSLTIGAPGENILTVTPGASSSSTIDFAASGSGQISFDSDVTMSGAGTGLTVAHNALVSGTLNVTGITTLAAQLEAQSGTRPLPGITFSADNTTGLWFGGANQLGIAVGGANKADYGISTAGQWTFSAPTNLTSAGIGLTTAGQAQFGTGIINPQVTVGNALTATGVNFELLGPAGIVRQLEFASGAALRWTEGTDNVAESGANSGANWQVQRFDDSGTLLDAPIQIDRSSGRVTMRDPLLLGAAGATVGTIKVSNATSGSITIVPPTGALGTPQLTWPLVTSTLATLAAQTFTGTQTFPDATAISSTGVALGSQLTPKALTVGTLPTCNAGAKGQVYTVTDATAPSYNATLTGGSTVTVLAQCNGTNWVAH